MTKKPRNHWRKWQWGTFLSFSLLSLLLHFGSFQLLKLVPLNNPQVAKNEPIKIKIMDKKTAPPQDSEPKKIAETKLEETEAPENARHLGHKNHKTLQETKISGSQLKKKLDRSAASVAGAPKKPQTRVSPPKNANVPKDQTTITAKPKTGPGKPQPVSVPRNLYEKLLAASTASMQNEMHIGYQDYMDDLAKEGETIDLNTQEYRYIGYFSNLRKAIELVWSYPTNAAQKGFHGKVSLQFTIKDSGEVSKIVVLSSSGHPILDSAIVEAIKLASPFAPLPKGIGKDSLNVQGTFHYVLH